MARMNGTELADRVAKLRPNARVRKHHGLSLVALLLAVLSACGKESRAPRPSPSASAPRTAHAAPSPSAAASASPRPTSVARSFPTAAAALDSGAACRLVYGPVQQPFVGAVALAAAADGVFVVSHHAGVVTVTHVAPTDPIPAPVPPASLPRMTSPPCAVAAGFAFCMDPSGAIHRTPLDAATPDVVIARGRPGTSYAAESIDGAHSVVGYLADEQTTEGVVTEAFAVLDGGAPVRLSDDGSGTTHLTLARRGLSLVALLVDGRAAMTPVHARTVAVTGGKLQVGEDTVIFVAGGAESATRGALGTSATGGAFALLPIAAETGFGVVSIRVDDPPHVDEPSAWSLYPNGLDPAPIAATRDVTPIRVARVRPLEARPDSPRGLELGKLDDAGAFVPYGFVESKGRVRSAAVAVDHPGMLWVAFTDAAGTWVERRACP
jgi:hypothetical protein